MIHRKKNRPALQRRDILTLFSVFFVVVVVVVDRFRFLRNFQGCFDILISFSGLF